MFLQYSQDLKHLFSHTLILFLGFSGEELEKLTLLSDKNCFQYLYEDLVGPSAVFAL